MLKKLKATLSDKFKQSGLRWLWLSVLAIGLDQVTKLLVITLQLEALDYNTTTRRRQVTRTNSSITAAVHTCRRTGIIRAVQWFII